MAYQLTGSPVSLTTCDEEHDRVANDGAQFNAWLRDTVNSKFFTTEAGRCRIGPGILREGDVIAVIFGCRVPVVLRRESTTGRFQFVGKCFMSELMIESEINFAANEWRTGIRKEEHITLV